MEEFEFARNITIGQYLAVNSFVHRMDPRAKLFCFAVLVGAIIFSASFTANAILLVAVFALVPLAQIPIRYALNGLRPALPIVIILAALQIAFYGRALGGGQNCVSFFEWGPIDSNSCGVHLALISTARFVELLILTSLLTFSTTVSELTLGTEELLAPLQRYLHLPVHELALAMTIALRFVPTFAEELERIVKAQLSRGADYGARGPLGFVRQLRALPPLVVPLFLSALRRGDELTLAMEARCYVGGKGRTHYLEFKSKPSDWLAVFVTIAFAVAIHAFSLAR